ncbi:hypothetical protein PC129_g12370 [Phytophthora cactorum]|uniref:Uncharacterized protein n=1 Tax=Phytophthora cactorum TaxID=29920 RepID=A0A329SIC4_9STRA|nr:hypothetical protein Pcac1_g5432 [Phytophthora cactorum]KAG2813016.1 hypothetical protein PC111_g14563 [Phytophthora cactorum]KAG2835283.1 hypothetical protein PC112_g5761 [Phytophthora cactorum]KAG2863492.1 hypothetical protein PC113_g5406 [Phytophthora cactorum]KAG2892109.1 hypothetical protein PC114_g16743 [Phytophthora cactorum]
MKMSKLLCVCPGRDEGETVPTPASAEDQDQNSSQVSTQATAARFVLVPDDERIRPHPLSAVQRRQRQEYQAYESRVYNLTLDINELRQQIQQLKERRDLYATRMILSGECFKGDVLKLVWTLLDGLRSGAIGLTPSARGFFTSRSHISQDDPEASGGVHQYVMQQGRCPLTNRSFTITSIRILAMVNNTTPGETALEVRRVCGNDGGCVVEVFAKLSGQITRDTLIALFPQVLSDGVLVSRMIGQQIKFSSRLLLFFNNQRRLMQQVAQADLVAALSALRLE